MNKRMMLFLTGLFLILFSNCMSAQNNTAPGNAETWNTLINQKAGLGLISYGLYKNGREMTRLTPSKRNHNRDECLVLGNKHILWLYSADGNYIFDYQVEGDKLILTNRRKCNENGVPTSVSDGFSTYVQMIEYKFTNVTLVKSIITDILTVDKYSTYRHFLPVTDY